MGNYINIWLIMSLAFVPAITLANEVVSDVSEEDAIVNITSNSSDADIMINGNKIGKSPQFELRLHSGKYRISSKVAGASEVDVTLRLEAATTTDVKLVHNDSEEYGNWLTRNSLVFGCIVGVGFTILIAALITAMIT